MLDSLELGYTSEVLHLARALHEASRLVEIFNVPEEHELLREWLAGEWVRPGVVRAAEEQERAEERLEGAMLAAGLPPLQRMGEMTRTIYGEHSEAAHHRRRWTQDAVSPAAPDHASRSDRPIGCGAPGPRPRWCSSSRKASWRSAAPPAQP